MSNQNQNQNKGQSIGMFGSDVAIQGAACDWHVHQYAAKLRKNPGDCGMDIWPSRIKEYVPFIGSGYFIVHTDFHVTPTMGTYMWLTDRSSSIERLRGGRILEGKIDAGYTGELLVRVSTPSADELCVASIRIAIEECISQKIAIAQGVIHLFCMPRFHLFSKAGLVIPAGRGNAGFGSTDKPT